jgi:hypothetical protein
MIVIAQGDEDSDTHYLEMDSRPKGCGRKNALCGQEVPPVASGSTVVTCAYCNKAYSLGEHLVIAKVRKYA